MRAAWCAAALALAFLTTVPGAAFPQDPEPAAVGRAAPEIQVTDWIDGDGRSSLADFRGDVVLVALWATHCAVSRGQVAQLTRLQDEYGRRGLTVLAITNEDRSTVQRYMAHNDANFGFAVGLGGAASYPTPTIPYAALIAPDGTVAYLGKPGSISGRDIEALLRKVPKPTSAEQERRAATSLAAAEALLAKGDVLRAEAILLKAAARAPATDSGRKAAARAKDLPSGDLAAEHAAQRELAKLVGGTVERPAEADPKRFAKLAKTFEKKAEEWREKAPRAAGLALEWRDLAAKTWAQAQAEKK